MYQMRECVDSHVLMHISSGYVYTVPQLIRKEIINEMNQTVHYDDCQ